MVKIVLHHQGEMFRVTVRPAGDGKFLRSNQGLMGSGSHKPHTDNIVSSLSCGNVFLAFMPRQLLSDLLNTVCSFHRSVRWHANVEGLAKHFADLQRHLVISEPKG